MITQKLEGLIKIISNIKRNIEKSCYDIKQDSINQTNFSKKDKTILKDVFKNSKLLNSYNTFNNHHSLFLENNVSSTIYIENNYISYNKDDFTSITKTNFKNIDRKQKINDLRKTKNLASSTITINYKPKVPCIKISEILTDQNRNNRRKFTFEEILFKKINKKLPLSRNNYEYTMSFNENKMIQ